MRVLTFLLAVLFAGQVYAATLTGRVVGVINGDTITVLDASKAHKIRLAGIDAPELKQAYGTRSKENLSNLIYRKLVTVKWEKQDRNGQIIGTVRFTPEVCLTPACLNQADAGYEQIAAGLAWHYKEHAKEQARDDRDRYAAAESQARAAKRGLWADPAPVPPWEWRKSK
jgi:endonuclease YncB( thermonuclease family)